MHRGSNRRAVPVLVVTAAATFVFAGCATKSYVRDQVGELGTRMDSETGELRTRVDHNARTAADAADRANAAMSEADRAHALALGDVGYRTVEEFTVNFAFDSAELSSDARMTLDRVADTVRENNRCLVDVLGHADTTGPEAYNDELSRRRAASVMRYLVQRGPGPVGRYAIVGFGESTPIVDAGTEDRRASRRVQVALLERVDPAQEGTPESHAEEVKISAK